MKHLVRLGSILAAYVALTGNAYAVFSTTAPLPEPGSLGLLVAGVTAIAGLRYLSKRSRNDKRDD